jgi:hypothetical protein
MKRVCQPRSRDVFCAGTSQRRPTGTHAHQQLWAHDIGPGSQDAQLRAVMDLQKGLDVFQDALVGLALRLAGQTGRPRGAGRWSGAAAAHGKPAEPNPDAPSLPNLTLMLQSPDPHRRWWACVTHIADGGPAWRATPLHLVIRGLSLVAVGQAVRRPELVIQYRNFNPWDLRGDLVRHLWPGRGRRGQQGGGRGRRGGQSRETSELPRPHTR